jgi:hypothetical protein
VSESSIDVLVEPPGPFALFPDSLLQAVGNAGLHASLSTLQVKSPSSRCLQNNVGELLRAGLTFAGLEKSKIPQSHL